MQLPRRITLDAMQDLWAAIINPFIANPSLQSNILSNVKLIDGATVINHLLGRKLVGWRIIGIDGPASVYDKQAVNQSPQLTLVLISSAAVTAQIEVF
jgi:hypothetical protein